MTNEVCRPLVGLMMKYARRFINSLRHRKLKDMDVCNAIKFIRKKEEDVR
jgi:hypothetical protein